MAKPARAALSIVQTAVSTVGILIALSLLSSPAEVFSLAALDRTSTVAGVDADGDGVRDDIFEFVAASKISTPSGRSAALNAARALRVAQTVDLTDGRAVEAAAQSLARAYACLDTRGGETGRVDGNVLFVDLEIMMANTPARVAAYEAFDVAAAALTIETAKAVCG